MKKCVILTAFTMCLAVGTASAGTCSKEEAKAAVAKACALIVEKGKDALGELQTFRFCGENYVWVQDTTPNIKMVMHPVKAAMNGKPFADKTDYSPEKKMIFIDFNKAAKEADGGWVDYLWPKPEEATPSKKSSYVKLCPGDLGWVAGAGIYP